MTAQILFFSVGNGDMTFIKTEEGRRILIDMNIRSAADDLNDDTPDVAAKLRKNLVRDDAGRLYIDALLISHPDEDHCRGLRKHFHLGPPGKWSKSTDKILIREVWSSPMVFRRASRQHILCDDAKAFNTEAKRRVRVFRDTPNIVGGGNRILILGEDEDGKTDDLRQILVPLDHPFSQVNGQHDESMTALLLAPLPADDDDEEEVMSKNNSSTILRFSLVGNGKAEKCRFLTGGDAGVVIWDKLWLRHSKHIDSLSYDILLSPHHCSWHSLSHDSWSELGENAKVSNDALNALSQARSGATIVASSKPIKNDNNDPPCIRAKREYEKIVEKVSGRFECVGEHQSARTSGVLEFEVGANGIRLVTSMMAPRIVSGSGTIGRQPHSHG